MNRKALLSVAGLVLAVLWALFVESGEASKVGVPGSASSDAAALASRPAEPSPTRSAPASTHPDIGFRSAGALDDHFAKHGREFGSVTKAQYLALAQSLRDAPIGPQLIEAPRADGVTCRFDRKSGAFLAVNADLTIRTFFKPNDGEAYFRRQLEREH